MADRRRDFEHTSFDFLGYTFRARRASGRRGLFVGFSPAMSADGEEGGRPARSGPGTSTDAVERTCVSSITGNSPEMITEIPQLVSPGWADRSTQLRWGPFEAGGSYASQPEGAPLPCSHEEKTWKLMH